MSRNRDRIAEISARMSRIERKCNRIITELSALRRALMPRPSELDEVIGHLHRTAKALQVQGERERRFFSGIAGGR